MRNFRIFQNSLVRKILREDVNFPSISEKCFNLYKNYEKNFHHGIQLKMRKKKNNIRIFPF